MEDTRQLERYLAWEGCYNIRDIGGYATDDGRHTRWRALVRADNLCRLSEAGCAALRAYGVGTIIDLRGPAELALAPHPFAVNAGAVPVYLHLPFEDWTDSTYDAAISGALTMEQLYAVMLRRDITRVGAIVRAIAGAPEGGVLIHCAAGKDRTGLIVALLLSLAGVPVATIAADYALSDQYLQPRYEEMLRDARDDKERAYLALPRKAPPERIVGALALLEQEFGGVRAYLNAADVSDADIQRIVERIRE